MAYIRPTTMDGFGSLLAKPDTRLRQTVGADLVAYLADEDNSIECSDIGAFIDSLVNWTQSSNFKVSQNGLEAMTHICDRLDHDFWPYVSSVLPSVLDRLGDQRETVREKAHQFIEKILEKQVVQPQQLLEKISDGFSHKNSKIREEVLRCFVNVLNTYGTQNLSLGKFTPNIVKLVSDPIPSVRDSAINTLVEIYRHVGERLRYDLNKKGGVPSTKQPMLYAKFDQMLTSGELLPTALTSLPNSNYIDEPDRAMGKSKAVKRVVSAPTVKRPICATPNTGPAGAVDESTFVRSFEDVPTIQLFTGRELNDHMKEVKDILSNTNEAWDKRVNALKKIRSLLIAGATQYDDFITTIRSLENALEAAVLDLRSQVVREACATIAHIAQELGNRFEVTAKYLINSLIGLIQNSAKVVATAGALCLRHMLSYCHSPKFIPVVTQSATTSKSSDIRKECHSLILVILNSWSSQTLKKQVTSLADAIKKGIADADAEARQTARKAFWAFKEHFPDAGESLLRSLEPTYRRAVLSSAGYSEQMSSSSSSSSLNQAAAPASTHKLYRAGTASNSGSTAGSTENLSQPTLSRAPSLPRSYRQRSGIPVLTRDTSLSRNGYTPRAGMRSYTAIDLQAAQRAKARTQYAQMARQKIASGTASLRMKYTATVGNPLRDGYKAFLQQGEVAREARPRKTPKPSPNATIATPERPGRARSRPLGVSQSQPTSRSVSPSLRMGYTTYSKFVSQDHDHSSPKPRKLSSSGIPRSTSVSRDHSRETSPTRRGHLYSSLSFRGSPGPGLLRSTPSRERPPISPHRPPVMAQKILQQSQEAENALAAALSPEDSIDFAKSLSITRKLNRSLDNPSDESEASSVCSERSFDSYRRPSDSYSLSGSHTRLSRDHWESISRDISEIIALCAESTWTKRKEGLLALYSFFSDGKRLTDSQLKKVTEIFPKMFMDSNTKVVSLFLDTLNELILTHHNELHDWLYVLLQRIFNKLGVEQLNSIYKKFEKTLEVIRENFPIELQIHSIFRYLTDNTQTPNSKVKVTILVYIIHLTQQTDTFIFDNKHLIAQGIEKIIAYTEDKKSNDVQNTAKNCLVALFNCNTPHLTMLLSTLPHEKQEIASEIITMNLKKSSTGSSPLRSPLSLVNQDSFTREDIQRSLRHTTTEIQNYSFDTHGSGGASRLERDSTSQDSGISTMSTGNGTSANNKYGNGGAASAIDDDSLEAGFAAMKISSVSQLKAAGPMSLPNPRIADGNVLANGIDYDHISETEVVQRVIDINSKNYTESEKLKILNKFAADIKSGKTTAAVENFRVLLRVLLDMLENGEDNIRCAVLMVMTEIFQSKIMKEWLLKFAELLTLKIICAHKSSSKEVVRQAEKAAAAMTMYPLEVIVRVINPVIVTEDQGVLVEGAIKMLTKMIEANGDQLTDEMLDVIVPRLIVAYDHVESTVRKCAVFCLVMIHRVAGEHALKPYISRLNSSKLKLLHVYIKRHGSSVPTSPKNSATSNSTNTTS